MNSSPRSSLKKILAISALALGFIMLFNVALSESWQEAASSGVLFLAFALPGGWWFRQEKRDRDNLSKFRDSARSHIYLTDLLGESDPSVVAGMGMPVPPQPVKRWWGLISVVAFALFLAGGALAPGE